MGTTTALSGLTLPGEPGAAGALAPKQYVDRVAADVYPATAQGFKAWSFDPIAIANSFVQPGTQVMYAARVWIPRATTINSISLGIQTAGATPTTGMVGLFDDAATMNRLGVSANSTASYTATGFKTISLTAGAAVSAGYYWLAQLYVGTTTPKIFGAGATNANIPNNMNGQRTLSWTGQTTIPATITKSSAGTPVGCLWIAAG